MFRLEPSNNRVSRNEMTCVVIATDVGAKPREAMHPQIKWGKLYADGQLCHPTMQDAALTYIFAAGDKDHELSTDDFNNKVIAAGDVLELNACGREDAASGTTGSFDLVDPDNANKLVRSFYWDCPWGSKTNTWTVTGRIPGPELRWRGAGDDLR